MRKYEKPQLENIQIEVQDIIKCSFGHENTGGTTGETFNPDDLG